MTIPALYQTMTTPAPRVTPAEAEALARTQWGLHAKATAQPGERDSNFHLHAEGGAEYILKFANADEDAEFRDMQIQALAHIARTDPTLPVPRIIPTSDGALQIARDDGIQARLLSWVPGTPLRLAPRSAAQRHALGAACARLQRALADFTHPADHHEISWDVQHTLHLRHLTFGIPHAPTRTAIEALFTRFEAEIQPRLPTLRRQAVHNDLTGNNVLANPANPSEIAGIIDFGDMAFTPIVIDIAVAAAALRGAAPEAAEFLRGYHTTSPLLPEEAELVPLLMAARVALSTTLACWHRHCQPSNPHYDTSESTLTAATTRMAEFTAPSMHDALMRVVEAK